MPTRPNLDLVNSVTTHRPKRARRIIPPVRRIPGWQRAVWNSSIGQYVIRIKV